MVKVLHAVNTVMTVQAGGTEICHMFHFEGWVMLSMASLAGMLIELVHVISVTVSANQGLVIVILGVVNERETGSSVVFEGLTR